MIVAFFLDYLTKDPVFYVSAVVAVVISITLHELGHGVAALWQGDTTPRDLGHMTLNPTVHMPPFSWLLLFLAGISYGLMPVNPRRFRSRFGDALVSAAGPAVNLVLSLVGLTVWALWIRFAGAPLEGTVANLQRFFLILGAFNLVLAVFNMLPVPPLDGSTVLASFSPRFRRFTSNPNNQPFFMGAFLLVFFFADRIWTLAYKVAGAWFRLLNG